MKKALFLFLTLCCLAATMVPKETRNARGFCEPDTPCSWIIYKGSTKIVDIVLNNNYCQCDDRTQSCQESEFETSTNAAIYRCQARKTENQETTPNS